MKHLLVLLTVIVLLTLTTLALAQPDDLTAVLEMLNIEPDAGTLSEEIERIELDLSEDFPQTGLPGQYGDFVLKADISVPQIETYGCVIAFRAEPSAAGNLYLLMLSQSTLSFSLLTSEGWENTELTPTTNPTRQLVLTAEGATFRVYIDGDLAQTYTDATIERGGIGFIGLAEAALPGESCVFTDVWLYDLEAAPSAAIELTAQPTTVPTTEPTAVPAATQQVAEIDARVLDTLVSLNVTPESGELIAPGQVVLATTDAQSAITAVAESIGNFVLHTRVDWRRASGLQQCMVFFRSGNTSAYMLQLFSDGRAQFLSGDANGPAPRSEWMITNNVVNQPGDPIDAITLVALNTEFRLYRDGRLVSTYQDAANTLGDVILYALSDAPTETAACIFDDVWLWDMGAAVVELPPEPTIPAALVASLSAAEIDSPPADILRDVVLTRGEFYAPFNRDHTDFAAAAEFAWGSSDVATCGIAFRVGGDSAYYVSVDQGRGVQLSRVDSAGWQDVGAGDTDLLFVGEGGTNTLLVVARGDVFDVYVNGALIDTFRDSQLTAGEVALMTGGQPAGTESEIACTVKQAWLWELGD